MKFERQEAIQPRNQGVARPDYVAVPTCCGLVVVPIREVGGSSAVSQEEMENTAADGAQRSQTASRAAAPIYALSAEAVLALFDVDADRGLSSAEAKARLATHGPNEIEKAKPVNLAELVLRQFVSPVIWLLVAAALQLQPPPLLAWGVILGLAVTPIIVVRFVELFELGSFGVLGARKQSLLLK